MSENIGKCPKCGEQYYGWALNNPDEQYCEICGCGLEIYNYKDAAKFNPFLLYPKYKVTASWTERRLHLYQQGQCSKP